MSTFPALIPSSRTFTPGEYAATAFAGYSGKQNRVRHSNVFIDAQLRLSFVGLSEAQMLQIWSHYSTAQGTFQPFTLSAEAVSNSTIGDYVPSNYLWQYGADGSVEDLPCGGHNVTLTLEAVPSQGMAIGGLAKVVTFAIAASAAAAANGASLTVATAVDGGTAGGPGIDATVTASIAAGSVSIIPDGIEATITASLESGLAAAANGIDAQVTCSLAGGSFGDPNFADVSLLLHMDGSNGGTTFTDNSGNAFTVVATGATTSTTQVKFGSAAMACGSTSRIDIASDAAFSFAGDFTVEFWVWKSSSQGAGNVRFFELGIYTDGILIGLDNIYVNGSFHFGTLPLINDTWCHYALTRSGATLRSFVDGVQYNGTSSQSGTVASGGSAAVRVGQASHTSGQYLDGYIDELRITKGVARYTADFTPPAVAFPDS